MAMLDREKFFERIKERLGEDDSDEALSFLEDVTDTYDDLERRAAGDGEDWKGKYEAWTENGENVTENVSSELAKK